MMSLDQAVALQIDEQSFSLATELRSAAMRNSFCAIDDYISAALVASYAEENGIAAGGKRSRRQSTTGESRMSFIKPQKLRVVYRSRTLACPCRSSWPVRSAI